jgi:hypothetical protein
MCLELIVNRQHVLVLAGFSEYTAATAFLSSRCRLVAFQGASFAMWFRFWLEAN